jgi:hypothetical protein
MSNQMMKNAGITKQQLLKEVKSSLVALMDCQESSYHIGVIICLLNISEGVTDGIIASREISHSIKCLDNLIYVQKSKPFNDENEDEIERLQLQKDRLESLDAIINGYSLTY